jgi:hypothetical protein
VGSTNLLDVLALKLGEKLLETIFVGVDTNRFEDSLDVRSRGRVVASEAKEKIGSKVLHFVVLIFCVVVSVIIFPRYSNRN